MIEPHPRPAAQPDPQMQPPHPLQPPYPVQPPPTEPMAIVGFICGFLFWPAGLILNPLALGRIKRAGTAGRGLAIAGLVLSIAAAAMTALVAVSLALGAVAVNGMEDAGSRAEARSSLTSVGIGVEAFYASQGHYPSSVEELEQSGLLRQDVGEAAVQAGLDITTAGSSYCLSIVGGGKTYWYSSDDGLTDKRCR
jgi:hypothetical protein